MLVAKSQDGTILSLLSLTRNEIQQYRMNTYYCPCCNKRVNMKAGRVKIPHFAHMANETCHYASEGESLEHLQGKKHLYEWLNNQGYAVELEKYFSTFQQRADLYVIYGNQGYAIEFQCSSISLDEMIKRTQTYLQHRIIPLWILCSTFLKRRRYNTYLISSFQWYAISGSLLAPRLFFYSPSLHQMTVLSQLTSFSSRLTISKPQFMQLKQLSFPQLLQTPVNAPIYYSDWIIAKQKWRLNASQYATFSPGFYRALYLARMFPATFPHEIGIPVPYGHFYKTHTIEWQFWLLERVLKNKMLGDSITSQDWKRALIYCLKEKTIVLRHFPFLSPIKPLLPVKYYVYMLENLGVLKRIEKGKYILNRLVENFNPEEPQQEKVFYQKVSFIYNELMRKALS
ncbi:competence protein CoiA [Bacillus massiliigorillae]|uniref:competence protein CoiA n=1 Tax=Bacillus massiliigorillae TaxID=1243664 RepID=UPI0003A422C4|nr:competence protein CoiA family protein [Bacillus massiliigorillae]